MNTACQEFFAALVYSVYVKKDDVSSALQTSSTVRAVALLTSKRVRQRETQGRYRPINGRDQEGRTSAESTGFIQHPCNPEKQHHLPLTFRPPNRVSRLPQGFRSISSALN